LLFRNFLLETERKSTQGGGRGAASEREKGAELPEGENDGGDAYRSRGRKGPNHWEKKKLSLPKKRDCTAAGSTS